MTKTKILDRLIETIVQDIRPEKIFLISHYEKQEQLSHTGLDITPSTNQIAKYDLLILINQIQDFEEQSVFVECRTRIIANVTALVYSMNDFNSLLEYGHPFIIKLMASDSLVYDAQGVDFGIEGCIDPVCEPYSGNKDFQKGLANAEEFFNAGNLHVLRKSFEIAAFNLHQCAEQLYITALQKATGLRMISSDITRLQRYSFWFSEDMRSILNAHRESNIHLGRFLQKAYFNARYNPNYIVSSEQLLVLLGEIRRLFDLTIKLVKGAPD